MAFLNTMKLFNLKKKEYLDNESGMGVVFQSKNLKSKELKWGKAHFLNAYKYSLYVNKALNIRKQKVGEVKFELERNGKKVEQDDVLKLLDNPSAVFSARQFYAMWQNYKDVFGEVYIYLERNKELFGGEQIVSMTPLYPPSCEPKFDDFGKLIEVKYTTKGGGSVIYKAEEIIYDFRVSIDKPLRGTSLLEAGSRAVSMADQIDDTQVNLLRNGGRVDGIITFKGVGTLTTDQRNILKKDYRENYAEAVKSGTPLFLGGDTDYKRVALTPAELGFIESKKMTLNDVCILTEVPKILMASTDDIQYANADTAMRVFLRETIKPAQEQIADKLFNKLKEKDGTITKLSIVDQTPEDIEQKIKIAQAGISSYFMTINEARKSFGLKPITDGGDEILAPFNVAPISQVIAEPEPLPAPVEPVDNPANKNDEENDSEEDGQNKDDKQDPAKKAVAMMRDHNYRRLYFANEIKKADNNEKIFKVALRKYLKNQKYRIVSDLKDQNIKAFKKKDLISELFNHDLEIKLGLKELLPILKSISQKAGWDASKRINSRGYTYTSDQDKTLTKRAEFFLKEINKTTFNKLNNVVADNIKEGKGREDLIKNIEDTFDNISKGRANTIARTEVHTAMNEGTANAYKQGGMTLKTWVAVLDDATRDSHAMLDGEERPLNMAFSNGLMYPGDPNGDAEETCNCRCVI